MFAHDSVEVNAGTAFAWGSNKLILVFNSFGVDAGIERTELVILVFHRVEVYIGETFARGRFKLIMGFYTVEVVASL